MYNCKELWSKYSSTPSTTSTVINPQSFCLPESLPFSATDEKLVFVYRILRSTKLWNAKQITWPNKHARLQQHSLSAVKSPGLRGVRNRGRPLQPGAPCGCSLRRVNWDSPGRRSAGPRLLKDTQNLDLMRNVVLWPLTSCNLIDSYKRFRGIYCLHLRQLLPSRWQQRFPPKR